MSALAARPLTREEYDAFRLARLLVADRLPYFMHAIFAMQPLAAPGLGTFAVDAAWRLYMDPALLVGDTAWTPSDVAAVLSHEVGHLLRDHAGRAANLPHPFDALAWNYAGDAEINDDLLAAGVPLPGEPVTPAGLGCPDNLLAEDYYQTTRQLGLPIPAPGDGCGSGAGGVPAPGELPAGVTLAVEDVTGTDGESSTSMVEGLSAAGADMVRRRVAHAITETVNGEGRGSVPAGLDRWASTILAPPTISWHTVLRAAVRRAVATAAGATRHTYTRPSRRRVPGVILPAMRGPKVRVAIVVDTSASMGTDDLDAAMAEISGVLRTAAVDRSRVMLFSCDAAASTATRLTSVTDIHLVGGGGTDMRVGIAAAEATRPHVIIVLTDGGTPWPDAPTRSQLVCAIITCREPTGTPEWATTVHITPAQVA